MVRTLYIYAPALWLMVLAISYTPASASPSFDCKKAALGSVEELICRDSELSSLDRKLSEVFHAALSKEEQNPHPLLKAEQRGWIKGRNECWKSADLKTCVRDSYQTRIAELQARYGLLEATNKIFYECEDNPANEVIVTFFETIPKTIVAERGDRTFLLFSRDKKEVYTGSNETIEIEEGKLRASLAFQAPFMNCRAIEKGVRPCGIQMGRGLSPKTFCLDRVVM